MYDRFGEAGVSGAAAGNGAGAYAVSWFLIIMSETFFVLFKLQVFRLIFQTNPFDLFESIFGTSMGGFNEMGGMGASSFRTSRRDTPVQGNDIRSEEIRCV